MTREEKISAICDRYIDSIMTNNAASEWISGAILYGRIGLEDMSDAEIDEQFELWCEDDDETV